MIQKRPGVASKTVVIAVAIVLVIAVIAGLLYWKMSGGGGPSAPSEHIIKLGVQLPLSGSLAKHGESELRGIKLAVKHFEQDNPNYKIELIVKDDESNPEKARTVVENLITIDNVVAITGGYGSHIIYTASEAAENYKTVYITSGGVSPNLVERGFKYFFRITNLPGYAAAQLGAIKDIFKAKKVAIIYNEKTATSELANKLKEMIEQENVAEIVVFESFPAGTADFKPLLTKVGNSGAEVLVVEGYSEDYINSIKSASAINLDVKAYVGCWGLVTKSIIDALGDLANYAYGTEAWEYGTAPSAAKSIEDRFYNDFKSEYNIEPDYLAMLGYVQTSLLLKAIKNVVESGKELNGDNIRQALLSLDEITPIGRVKFGDNGDSIYYKVVLAQIQGSGWKVVWTPEGPTGNAVYPAVGWK